MTQTQFRKWQKPAFCYLCGSDLAEGDTLNDDHCPPKGMFAVSDRADYAVKLKVHARCNHRWHLEDEKMAIFYDVLHGATKASNPRLQEKLSFVDIETDQGMYQGITNFPLRPLTSRIIRCVHAILYVEHLPNGTLGHVHYPIPEADQANQNRPLPHLPQTYSFADTLCTAQKTGTYDCLVAYNTKFRYVCTWSQLDNGHSICIFSFDVYRLSRFAVRIRDFPQAVIGFYGADRPTAASRCSDLELEHSDGEILYPLISS